MERARPYIYLSTGVHEEGETFPRNLNKNRAHMVSFIGLRLAVTGFTANRKGCFGFCEAWDAWAL